MYALKGTWFEARRREPKKPPFKFLVPIIYAPILPLIRISLKKQPILRDRVFGVVLAAALIHGGYLVYPPCTSYIFF
uniref:Predicted protein n=1 Tax=Physcomitrium patens TaxID=3218 RepID=A9U4N5_PHYPA